MDVFNTTHILVPRRTLLKYTQSLELKFQLPGRYFKTLKSPGFWNVCFIGSKKCPVRGSTFIVYLSSCNNKRNLLKSRSQTRPKCVMKFYYSLFCLLSFLLYYHSTIHVASQILIIDKIDCFLKIFNNNTAKRSCVSFTFYQVINVNAHTFPTTRNLMKFCQRQIISLRVFRRC